MKTQDNLVWQTVDPSTLSQVRQAQFAEMKRIYKSYTEAKQAFERGLNDDSAGALGAGNELKFGYRFGKLSVAIAPKTATRAPTPSNAPSLDAFLRAALSSGRNA